MKELNMVQRNADQQNARVNVQPQKQSGHAGGRRQPIVGKGEIGADLRATPLTGRDSFVYRIHKEDGEKEFSEFINRKNVVAIELIRTVVSKSSLTHSNWLSLKVMLIKFWIYNFRLVVYIYIYTTRQVMDQTADLLHQMELINMMIVIVIMIS